LSTLSIVQDTAVIRRPEDLTLFETAEPSSELLQIGFIFNRIAKLTGRTPALRYASRISPVTKCAPVVDDQNNEVVTSTVVRGGRWHVASAFAVCTDTRA